MKTNQILAIILVLFLGIFLVINLGNNSLNQSNQVKQTINYADFNIVKTITFSTSERIEEYSFYLKNPVVAYLLLPKELVSNASLVKISGDFSSQILAEDGLVKLTPTDYSPGTKKLTLKFTDSNIQLTSILFALPYASFNEMTNEQKTTLDNGVKDLQINSSLDNYYIDNSRSVMQQFANDQKKAGLSGEDSTKIFFAQAIDPNQILTSISQFLKKKDEPAKVISTPGSISSSTTTSTQILSGSDIGTTTLANMSSALRGAASDTSLVGPTITITFSPESLDYSPPKKIEMAVSKEFTTDSYAFLIKNSNKGSLSSEPTIKVEGELSENIHASIWDVNSKSDNQPIYSILIDLNVSKEALSNYLLGNQIQNNLIINFGVMQGSVTIPLSISIGLCEQQVVEVSRQVGLFEDQKLQMILACYSNQLNGVKQSVEQNYLAAKSLREKMILDVNSIDELEQVTYFTNQMEKELTLGGGYGSGTIATTKSLMQVNSKDFAYMKLFDLLSISSHLNDANCDWVNKTNLKLLLVPKSLYKEEYSFTFDKNIYSDENSVRQYYYSICNTNNLNAQSVELFNGAKNNFSRALINNSLTYDENTLKNILIIFETNAQTSDVLFEMQKLFSSNKITVASFAQKAIYSKSTQLPPSNILEQGWIYPSRESILADVNWLNDLLEDNFAKTMNNYSNASKFFSCDNNYCSFYNKYFSLSADIKSKSKEANGSPDWVSELSLVKSIDDYYKQLASYPNIDSQTKTDTLKQGVQIKNLLLENYLLQHFDSQISDDIQTLDLLENAVANQTLTETKWYELIYKPFKIGEFAGTTMQNLGNYYYDLDITDSETKALEGYLTNIQTKKNNLKKLKILISRDYLGEQKSQKESTLDFFQRIKIKYSNIVDYQNLLRERNFVKFLNLEIQLQGFNDKNAVDSNYLKNFIKKEQTEEYASALQYGTDGVLPIERIKLSSIIETQQTKDTNPFYNSELVLKAQTELDKIKPELTKFEKISNWVVGLFKTNDTKTTELENATIDYRTPYTIWANRLEGATDLRYWIGFEVGGRLLLNSYTKPIYQEIFARSVILTTTAKLTKATWEASGQKMVLLFAKVKGQIPESVLAKLSDVSGVVSSMVNSVVDKAQVLNPRNYERARLTKLYSSSPRLATILGSEFSVYSDYLVAKAVGEDISTSILKQNILSNNILKRVGNIRELYGSEIQQSALKIIDDSTFIDAKKQVHTFADGSVTTLGTFSDTKGAMYVIISETRPEQGLFGVNQKTITRVFNIEDNLAAGATSTTDASAMQAITYLLENSTEDSAKGLVPVFKGIIGESSLANEIKSSSQAVMFLKNVGVYSTHFGVVSIAAEREAISSIINLTKPAIFEKANIVEVSALLDGIKPQIISAFKKPQNQWDLDSIASSFGGKFLGSGGNGSAITVQTSKGPIVFKFFRGGIKQADIESSALILGKGNPLFQQYITHGKYVTGGAVDDLGNPIEASYIVSELAQGKSFTSAYKYSEWQALDESTKATHLDAKLNELKQIPDEHWDQLVEIYQYADKKGIMIDPNPENFIYDSQTGFIAIDYHVQIRPNISQLSSEAPILLAGKDFAQRGEAITQFVQQKIDAAIERQVAITEKEITLSAASSFVIGAECVSGCVVSTSVNLISQLENDSLAQLSGEKLMVNFPRISSIKLFWNGILRAGEGYAHPFSPIVQSEIPSILPAELRPFVEEKVLFVNGENFAILREKSYAECDVAGCYFSNLASVLPDNRGAIAINLENGSFYDGKGNFNVPAIKATIAHEKVHRAINNLSSSDLVLIQFKIKNNPNWNSIKLGFKELAPESYAGLTDGDIIEEMLARAADYKEYPAEYAASRPEVRKLIEDFSALVDGETTQLLAKGENIFLESIGKGEQSFLNSVSEIDLITVLAEKEVNGGIVNSSMLNSIKLSISKRGKELVENSAKTGATNVGKEYFAEIQKLHPELSYLLEKLSTAQDEHGAELFSNIGLLTLDSESKIYFINGERVNFAQYIEKSFADKGINIKVEILPERYSPTNEDLISYTSTYWKSNEAGANASSGSYSGADLDAELFKKYRQEIEDTFTAYIRSGRSVEYDAKFTNLGDRVREDAESVWGIADDPPLVKRMVEYYNFLNRQTYPFYQIRVTDPTKGSFEAMVLFDDLQSGFGSAGYQSNLGNKALIVVNTKYTGAGGEGVVDLLNTQRILMHETDHFIQRNVFGLQYRTANEQILLEGLSRYADAQFLINQRKGIKLSTGKDLVELSQLRFLNDNIITTINNSADKYVQGLARVSLYDSGEIAKLYTRELTLAEVTDIYEVVQDITTNVISFSCNSPCVWNPTDGVVVTNPDGGSVVVFENAINLEGLKISGDFGKGYIKGTEIVEYSSQVVNEIGINSIINATRNLPNIAQNGIVAIENAMKNGKIVSVISPDSFSGSQKITVYVPTDIINNLNQTFFTSNPQELIFGNILNEGEIVLTHEIGIPPSTSETVHYPYIESNDLWLWNKTNGKSGSKSVMIEVPTPDHSQRPADNLFEAQDAVKKMNEKELTDQLNYMFKEMKFDIDSITVSYADGSMDPLRLVLTDSTPVTKFDSTTQKTGIEFINGIPTKEGEGYTHASLNAVDYGGQEQLDEWIVKTFETPDYSYSRDLQGPKKIFIKAMNDDASKLSLGVISIMDNTQYFTTIYQLESPMEYLQIIRSDLAKGNYTCFKSKMDPHERLIQLSDELYLSAKKGQGATKDIFSIEAKRGTIDLGSYETVSANNVYILFSGLDSTKVNFNLSQIKK